MLECNYACSFSAAPYLCVISPHISGLVSTIAGSGSYGHGDGQGSYARFYHPFAVAVDTTGIVYVADSDNNRIRLITPGGQYFRLPHWIILFFQTVR